MAKHLVLTLALLGLSLAAACGGCKSKTKSPKVVEGTSREIKMKPFDRKLVTDRRKKLKAPVFTGKTECVDQLPGRPETKLVEASTRVPAARSMVSEGSQRAVDRLTVVFKKDTTVGQANEVLKKHGLRVGAFPGRSAFATVCTPKLGAGGKLEEAAAALKNEKIIASAQPLIVSVPVAVPDL